VHTAQSKSQRSTEWLASSTTTSEHRSIEPAIMASEIERLSDLEGFLKFASIPDWMRVRLAHVSYPIVARNTGRDSPGSTPEPSAAAPVAALSDTAKSEQGETGAEIGEAAKKSRRTAKLGD